MLWTVNVTLLVVVMVVTVSVHYQEATMEGELVQCYLS